MQALAALALTRLLIAAQGPEAPPPPDGHWLDPIEVTGQLDRSEVSGRLLVYLPKGYAERAAHGLEPAPLVIALHGWDHSPELFRDQSNLALLADTHGFVVAVPDTGRTIFETRFYKETRGKWRTVPGARLVGEVILPHLRKHFHVAADRRHTAIIGYSTGGRGAVLVAALYPEFAFAGSVSGTFDLMSLDPKSGEYRIHAIIYGNREKHADRWQRDNCVSPEHLAKLAGVELYTAHGAKDKSVPPAQLDALKHALEGAPNVHATFVMVPDAGHEWPLWNAQWRPMFEAFARVMASP